MPLSSNNRVFLSRLSWRHNKQILIRCYFYFFYTLFFHFFCLLRLFFLLTFLLFIFSFSLYSPFFSFLTKIFFFTSFFFFRLNPLFSYQKRGSFLFSPLFSIIMDFYRKPMPSKVIFSCFLLLSLKVLLSIKRLKVSN